ncbi:hypothetical protein MJG53_001290 [Ovis ammon polii x Ovis aries]|uniref:Uncharacterized protein n=1 Tax=Ovis ammon polii x Ovis aries TaxID=2918886 RepID=A0ACB9VLB0_9CETA|nr:hypothetical protein MJG53_001290 [Ovis ammon polii x Ovis aries]
MRLIFSHPRFPPQMLQTGLKRGKWGVCGSLPASHLQGSRQDFHSLAGPHSPPHDSARNRKRNFARTIARPAALRSGVNWVPGHFRKGWQLLQRQALSGTLDRKAAILAGLSQQRFSGAA